MDKLRSKSCPSPGLTWVLQVKIRWHQKKYGFLNASVVMQQTPPIAYFKGTFVNVLWYDSRMYPLQFCHKVICSNVSHSFMLLKISDSNTIIVFQTFVHKDNAICQCEFKGFSI